jgi:hypothetical protein
MENAIVEKKPKKNSIIKRTPSTRVDPLEPQFWSFQCIVFSLFPFFNDVCAPKCQPSKKSAFQTNPMRFVIGWFAMSVVLGKCNRWLITKAPSLAEFAHVYNKESNK